MTHEALLHAYLAGADDLRAAIDGLSEAQLRARPIAGAWSTLEVVCHLADSELLFAERMKRVLAEDRPTMLFADPTRYVTALAYHERSAADEVALVALLRRQMTTILHAQPPEAWSRIGVHNKEGERTLEQLVRKAVDHLAHHLAFVREKRTALGVG